MKQLEELKQEYQLKILEAFEEAWDRSIAKLPGKNTSHSDVYNAIDYFDECLADGVAFIASEMKDSCEEFMGIN